MVKVRVKEIRVAFGDTLQSLASKINYDYSNLSKVERGVYSPSLELLEKIANVYNIDISYLIESNNNNIVHLEDKKYDFYINNNKLSEIELKFIIQSLLLFRNK